MAEDPKTLMAQCTRFLTGHKRQSPVDAMAEVAAWTKERGLMPDVYGEGASINDFEAEVAALLGQEAAVFMPSGTMAQQIAARIYSERSGRKVLGLHPTCHLELHEHKGYAFLHGMTSVSVGSRTAPTTAADVAACGTPLAALIVELPYRELGGVLPSWEALEELKREASRQNLPLHLDGARLWEAQAFYGRGFAEICRGFSSVYVSFYKGIGAFAGAMLLGPAGFIAESRVWQRRHGGNLYTLLPYVAAARLNFARRLPEMARYRAEAQRVAAVVRGISGLHFRPAEVQVNMFHLHFDRPAEAVASARDAIAREEKVWLCGRPVPQDRPGTCSVELSFGEAAAELSDEDLRGLLSRLAGT